MKSILLTKTREEAESFIELEDEFSIIFFPTIEIQPVEFDQRILNQEFTHILFTSSSAANIFIPYVDNYFFSNKKIVAVGEKTATTISKHLPNNITIPDDFSVQGIINLLQNSDSSAIKILFPCSSLSDNRLDDFCQKNKIDFTRLVTYTTITAKVEKSKKFITQTNNNIPELYIFTSPSSFRGFIELMNITNHTEYFFNKTIAAIGNTTRDELIKNDLVVDILPEESSLAGLKKSIIKYYRGKSEY